MLGRNDEIDLVINLIQKKETCSNTVIISSFNGMPAVGKTTLSIRVAHMFSSQYPDAQLFIDCYGYTPGHNPLNKEQILDSLLFSLGIASTRIPEKYFDKLSLWRLELNKRSVIIVFDNVKIESQIDELIPSSTNSLFLITSRTRLLINDCYPISIDVLDPDESVLILNGGVPENNKVRNELLIELSQKYGYLPLALQIISHQIKGKSEKYIKKLIQNRNKLGNLSTINNSLYQSFDVSYEKLNHSEQELLQVLGLFPGNHFTPCSCAAMLGTNTTSIYTCLDILHQQNLIKAVGDECYVLHDLMRDFSQEKYYTHNDNNHAPLIRLIQYYIESTNHCNQILYPFDYRECVQSGYSWLIDDLPSTANDALTWFKNELKNILACLETAKTYEWHCLYFKLSYVLSHYIMKSLPGWHVVKIYKDVVSYTDLDKWMYAASLTNLALAYYHAGKFNVAVTTFLKAEDTWRSLGNWNALAYTLGNHAFTLERLGKYQEALVIIEEALKIEEKLTTPSIIASILNSKGAVYWRMKQYSTARNIFEEVIRKRQEIGDEYGASNSINNLAFTLLRLGDERAAREGFIKSLDLSTRYQDYSGVAVTLNNLGYTEIYLNHPNRALDYAQEAFDVSSQIGDEYQIARSYDVKSKAYLLLNDNNNAIYYIKLALSLFDNLNVPEADETRSILNKLKESNRIELTGVAF